MATIKATISKATTVNALIASNPDINVSLVKTGATGATGSDGDDGADSTVPGPQGIQGGIGATGSVGQTGADSTVPGPAGNDGQDGEDGVAEKNEYFTLDATDITNKYVDIIGDINDSQSVHLFIENIGLMAEVGIDFSYSGNNVYWSGYELVNTLEVGDKLRIFYT